MADGNGDLPKPPGPPKDLVRRVVLQLALDPSDPQSSGDAFLNGQSARWKDLQDRAPGIFFQSYFSNLRQSDDPNLHAFHAIVCPAGLDPEPISQEVAKWPGVLLTYVEPLPHVPPVVKPSDDPRSGNQGYLTAAPEGIDALWAWSLTDGTDIDFVDVEQGWILNHEDLIGAGITIISGLSREFCGHGAAVLGVVGAVDNSIGGIGIAPNARIRVVSQWRTNTSFSTGDAIQQAAEWMRGREGGVLLIGAQTDWRGHQLPVEVEPAVFAAIRAACNAGIVVVEAAGNGGFDLNSFIGDDDASFPLNRNRESFQDSGAIMVAAGSYKHPHSRLPFSN